MIEHEVSQGECMTSIALEHGTLCKRLWAAPENEDLRDQRASPNVLFPGDVVRVNDQDRRSEDRGAESRHRFRKLQDKVFLRLRILDMGTPRAGEKYVLKIGNSVLEGQTSDQGRIEVQVPADTERAVLRLGGPEGGEDYILMLGELDPVTEPSGLQARLMHLGYDCEVSGTLDAATKRAVRQFQHDSDLPVTGEPDQVTTDQLIKVHES